MRIRREEMHTDRPWGNLNKGYFEKREAMSGLNYDGSEEKWKVLTNNPF
jgi:hypothetical protein